MEAQSIEKRILKGDCTSIIEHAFAPGDNGAKVTHFISALGFNMKRKEPSKYIEYISIRLFADICVKYKVENFILISSLCITRPYNWISYMLNCMADNVLGWKL